VNPSRALALSLGNNQILTIEVTKVPDMEVVVNVSLPTSTLADISANRM